MEKKKGNTTLIVIAAILVVFVIILIVIDLSLGGKSKNNTNSTSTANSSSTIKVDTDSKDDSKVQTNDSDKTTKIDDSTKVQSNTEKTTTTESKSSVENKDDENLPEEVKKIDNSKEKIYEKEITVGNRTTKVPIINLTTKAVTRINSEVESKYKEAYSNGYYIVYYYYMYIGMVSLILDNRYSDGSHKYELYNVNSETGKQMSNEDLLAKLKVNKDSFLTKAKSAYKAKFEELFKDVDKNSSPYKKALEQTLKNAENALNDPMYINLEAQFASYAKIVNVASGKEEYHLIEFK